MRAAQLIAWLAWSLLGCTRPATTAAPARTPPAVTSHHGSEDALATVTLTPEAESRLGIQTVLAERRTVSRTRTVGAEVVAPGGRTVTIAAPVAGTIRAVGRAILTPGATVRRGQPILRLVPLAPVERDVRAQAERLVAVALARVELLRARVGRAELLLRDRAGSQRALEEARADLAGAEADHRAAEQRLRVVVRGALESDTVVTLRAPNDAAVRQVFVAAGQSVAAATPLFEVAATSGLWIRVPLYAGDLSAIDRSAPARVRPLGSPGENTVREAVPIVGPPSADPIASTADVFFELPVTDDSFRAGERVTATLTYRGDEDATLVPWASIVHDVHGGTWLYETSSPHVFRRKRVELRRVDGETAVLDRGPVAGASVVSVGAAELFSTEFGPGH